MRPLKLVFLLFALLVSSIGLAVADPITELDYLNNFVCTDRHTFPSSFPAKEYNTLPVVPGIAFVRSGAISVKVHEVTTQSLPLGVDTVISGQMAVTSASYVGESKSEIGVSAQTFTISATTVPITITGPSGGDATLTLTGFPNFVRGGLLTVNYKMTGVDQYGFPHMSRLTHSICVYFVEASPKESMQVPWLEVLSDATLCASEKTGSDVAKYLTLNAFKFGNFIYPSDTGTKFLKPTYSNPYGPLTTLDLSAIYTSILDEGAAPVDGNCADVNSWLSLAQCALGNSFSVAAYDNYYSGSPLSMVSNSLCLIGYDPADDSQYSTSFWNWHLIARPSQVSTLIHDICAAHMLDLSGSAYRKPPVDWEISPFWNNTGSLGLVLFPKPSYPVAKALPLFPSSPFYPWVK